MAVAGTVEIDFAAETAKFTSELKKVRDDLKSLKDDTSSISASLRGASEAFGEFGDRIKEVASVGALIEGIKAVVEETDKSEKAVSQLNNALLNVGADVPLASKNFRDFASQMQQVTTFSSEAVLGVSSLLIGFRGLSSGTIKEATKDVLDLSSRLGIDLQTAAKSVGKALEDPVLGLTALQKAGVLFGDSQKKAVKDLVEAGNLASAQGIILKELEGRFTGAAEAARDTFGGALQGVKNNFNSLLEAEGGLPGATKALNDLSKELNSPDIKEGFQSVVIGLTKIVELSAQAAVGLAHFGQAAGDAIGKFLVPDSALTAAQALTKELDGEQGKLNSLQESMKIWGTAWTDTHRALVQSEIDTETAYIATLKQRISLSQQAQNQDSGLQKSLLANTAGIPGQVGNALSSFTTPGGKSGETDEELKKREALNQSLLVMISKFNDEEIKDNNLKRETILRDDFQQFVKSGDERQIALANQLNAEIAQEEEAKQRRQQIYNDFFDYKQKLYQKFGAKEVAFEYVKQQSIVSIGGDVLDFLATKSKTAAKIQQDIAIASAIWNTAEGITKALTLPWPLNFIVAAEVGIEGALQIAKIESTNIGASGSAPSFGGGGSAPSLSAPTSNPVFSDTPQTQTPTGAATKTSTQIIIQGDVFSSEKTASWFIDKLKDALDRDVVFIGQNTRQAQQLRG